jgi:hypothetical protein
MTDTIDHLLADIEAAQAHARQLSHQAEDLLLECRLSRRELALLSRYAANEPSKRLVAKLVPRRRIRKAA